MALKKKFKSLEILVKKRIQNIVSGSHTSLLKDAIYDIDSNREYQPGDKKLDSKSSLKDKRVFSRVFNPDKEIVLYLLLDISASLSNKKELLINSALFLTYLADIAFDKICLISFSDKINKFICPTNDTSAIICALERIYDSELEGNTNIVLPFNLLRGLRPNNSLIFCLSDFTEEVDIKPFFNNQIYLLRLKNEEERDFCNVSSVFTDIETGQEVFWDGKHQKIQDSYYLDLDDNEDYLLKIASYLSRK